MLISRALVSQFPSSFLYSLAGFQAYAVDWDKDGRRDIWGSTADSLASIANYLKENGWKRGRAYGFPVSIDQPIATESESEPVSGAAAAKAGSDQGEAEQSVDSLWPWERWSMGLGAFGVGGESSPSAPSPIGASKDVKAKPLPELYHGDVKRVRTISHMTTTFIPRLFFGGRRFLTNFAFYEFVMTFILRSFVIGVTSPGCTWRPPSRTPTCILSPIWRRMPTSAPAYLPAPT